MIFFSTSLKINTNCCARPPPLIRGCGWPSLSSSAARPQRAQERPRERCERGGKTSARNKVISLIFLGGTCSTPTSKKKGKNPPILIYKHAHRSQGNWTERRIINATLAGGGGDRGHLCAGAAAKGVHFNNFLNYVNRKRRKNRVQIEDWRYFLKLRVKNKYKYLEHSFESACAFWKIENE